MTEAERRQYLADLHRRALEDLEAQIKRKRREVAACDARAREAACSLQLTIDDARSGDRGSRL